MNRLDVLSRAREERETNSTNINCHNINNTIELQCSGRRTIPSGVVSTRIAAEFIVHAKNSNFLLLTFWWGEGDA